MAGGGVEAEEFGGLGRVGVEDEGGGFARDAQELGGGVGGDQNISGGGVLKDAAGEFAPIAKADPVGCIRRAEPSVQEEEEEGEERSQLARGENPRRPVGVMAR